MIENVRSEKENKIAGCSRVILKYTQTVSVMFIIHKLYTLERQTTKVFRFKYIC